MFIFFINILGVVMTPAAMLVMYHPQTGTVLAFIEQSTVYTLPLLTCCSCTYRTGTVLAYINPPTVFLDPC